MLLKMASRRGKREHAMAIDTLKDLFENDLLPDRRLVYFHQVFFLSSQKKNLMA
jgi:hypothetical protein